jgi:methylmalonyl-CoA mutase
MSHQTASELLLAGFPEHTYEQWHLAAEQLLKGASFEKLLVSKTYEDITIQPIYRREDIAHLDHPKHFPGAGSRVRGSQAQGFLKTGWEISQEIVADDPQHLNRIARQGIDGGQTELNILTDRWLQPECDAAPSPTLADLTTVLDGIDLGAIPTFWRSGSNSLPLAALFFAAARQRGLDPNHLRACFDNDPLAELVSNGSARRDLKTRFDQIAALTRYCQSHAPDVRTMVVQGDVYHNAGATTTQELGYVMATLVCYLEEMTARGLSPGAVMPHVRICLAVGSDYFMEISKIRAARALWSKVAAAYDVTIVPPPHIHASTSKWNKTIYDAHTNMLRVTAEAFAAVVAGVDSLHIGPYDEISGNTDEFSRRIARNIHLILRDECGLARVIDPAGGSSYIEWLTDQIAVRSWEIFQGIEQQGGMLACLKAGSVQQAVVAVRKTKFNSIRRRKDKIVGTNIYPESKGGKLAMKTGASCQSQSAPAMKPDAIEPFDLATMVEQAIAAALNGASIARITRACGLQHNTDRESPDSPEGTQAARACGFQPQASSLTITPLPPHRAAEEYEALRDAAAAFTAKTGAAPAILQLNIGPSRNFRLRADWTGSFFEAAGFAVDGTRDFITIGDAVNALTASTAAIAVITSDDATYLESVAPLAAAVKAARPDVTLLVAGTPGDHEAAWRAAGVDDFVNVRSNHYELNQQLLQRAGVL